VRYQIFLHVTSDDRASLAVEVTRRITQERITFHRTWTWYKNSNMFFDITCISHTPEPVQTRGRANHCNHLCSTFT